MKWSTAQLARNPQMTILSRKAMHSDSTKWLKKFLNHGYKVILNLDAFSF